MVVLGVLTIIYAAVLVVALATVLTLILASLWRIGTTLGRARRSLELVAERTRPLRNAVPPLHETINEHARDLEKAARDMAVVRDELEQIRQGTAQGSAA